MSNETYLNNHGEKPKRLTPKSETLRAIYIKSGNECAFPNCNSKMFDNGNYIGEVCHIEDAMPGGRFNPDKTNVQNREKLKADPVKKQQHLEKERIEIRN